MNVTLRPGTPDDAPDCGEIAYAAFAKIASTHGFPADFPSPDVAASLAANLLAHPRFHSVIAESDGRIVGSNFLDERARVAGVGPITVTPEAQNTSVGRRLMEAVIDRAAQQNTPGVRLVQAAYHSRSLSLYTKLGFATREPLSVLQGAPPGVQIAGHGVRAATADDVEACNALCTRVHGHDRGRELRDAVDQGTARVVEHDGQIAGYTTRIAFFGHAVGETNEALKALIAASSDYAGPGFLLPTRNTGLFRWCLAHGLRVVQPMTLMTTGLYNEPTCAYLPSIWY